MTTKSTFRRLAVGSLVGSLAMIGSVMTVGQGIAQAEEPGPVPNLPAKKTQKRKRGTKKAKE